MTRKRNSKKTRKWLIIGGIVAAGMLIGGYAYAKKKALPPPSKTPSPKQAVTRAIRLTPHEDVTDLTDLAYSLAYPNCPQLLDPDDPLHADCVQNWLALRTIVYAQLPAPGEHQAQPQEGLADTGAAADMRGWLESLSSSQRSGLKSIIGGKYYNPIKNAANRGDDADTIAAVLRFKRDAEAHAREHPLDAMAQVNDLQDLLGPKLDELMRLAQKYQ